MLKERFKHFVYRCILPYGGLLLIRLISMTYRIKIVDGQKEKEILESKNRLVYASWHQRFFPGITFFSTRKPIAIIISKSLDGEMIAKAVDILGWYPIRGSSSRGGKEALAKIKDLARSDYKIGQIVDGPRGPFGVIKPGLLRIAQAGQLPVVPTITSAQSKWVFNSWDRFMVPKPFSKIIIRFGDPIQVPEDLTPDAFEAKRCEIEERLKMLYKETDDIWTRPEAVRTLFN